MYVSHCPSCGNTGYRVKEKYTTFAVCICDGCTGVFIRLYYHHN